MSCKIFFSDLDGTLLTTKKIISPSTKSAVLQWMNAGNLFVLSSGRPLPSILEVISQNELLHKNLYVIAFNGGIVYAPWSREKLFEKTLTLSEVKEIVAIAKSQGIYCHTYNDTTILIPYEGEEILYYTKSIHLPYQVLPHFPSDVTQRPCKVLCISLQKDTSLDYLASLLQTQLSSTITCVRSNANLLEVFPKDSGKGAAVSILSEFLHIAHKDTYAAGDEQNDASMLATVAHSIAMCNGNPSLHSTSEYITTLDNDNDGLVPFFTKFLSQ